MNRPDRIDSIGELIINLLRLFNLSNSNLRIESVEYVTINSSTFLLFTLKACKITHSKWVIILQFSKTLLTKVVFGDTNVIFFKDEHPLKASYSIVVTENGIVNSFNPLQSQNEPYLIKAKFPITFTGIDILNCLVHFLLYILLFIFEYIRYN